MCLVARDVTGRKRRVLNVGGLMSIVFGQC